MLKIVVFAAAAITGTDLYAQSKMTAEDLLYICAGRGEPDQAFCQAYIAGVSEGGYTSAFFHLVEIGGEIENAEAALDEISRITRVCYDDATTMEEIIPHVIETIEKTPDLIEVEASVAVTRSLQLLFPCS